MISHNPHIIDYKKIQQNTPFNLELIKPFLKYYFLQEVEVSRIYGGFRNTSVLITAGTTRYVLRVYSSTNDNPNHTYAGIYCEWDFVNHLRQHNLPVPELVVNLQGAWFTEHSGLFCILMKYVEGVDGRFEITDLKFKNIGQIMGRMHCSAMTFVPKWSRPVASRNVFEHMQNKFEKDSTEISKLYEIFYQDYLATRSNFVNLPRYFIHNDLIFSNLLYTGNEVLCVLDFDDANEDVFVKELATFIVSSYDTHNLYTVTQSNIKNFMDSYLTIRPMSKLENSLFLIYFDVCYYSILRMLHKFRPTLILEFEASLSPLKTWLTQEYLS